MSDSPAAPAGLAMTVRGPVPAADLGMTLIHEHLHMDATPLLAVHGYPVQAERPFDLAAAAEARWNPGSHPDNYRFTDDATVAEELAAFRALGGGCVVDQTPPSLGRDPLALRAISEASGLHVVMGTGHYLAPTHAAGVAGMREEALAEAMAAEIRDGVGATGVRPGIIGEIGTSAPVDPEEERVLRAAARAATASGLAVSVHLHPWGRTGTRVLDVLLAEGLAPGRIVLGHLNTAWDDDPYLRGLADRGAVLAFDLFGFDHSLLGLGRWPPSDADVASVVVSLVRAGHGGRVLVSGDIGVRTRLVAFGSWGFAHVPRHVVPLLVERGLGEQEVEQMLVAGPSAVLAGGNAPANPGPGERPRGRRAETLVDPGAGAQGQA
jgi:phosphotriesterase-related protein